MRTIREKANGTPLGGLNDALKRNVHVMANVFGKATFLLPELVFRNMVSSSLETKISLRAGYR